MHYGNSSRKNFEKILIKKINEKQHSPTRTRIQTPCMFRDSLEIATSFRRQNNVLQAKSIMVGKSTSE